MKKYFPVIIILSLIICCHTVKVTDAAENKSATTNNTANKSVVASHKGNGTSIADAVIIQEKNSEPETWVEEKAWLTEKYPGYIDISVRAESKSGANGHQMSYDIHKIKTTDGAEFEVFFDVSIFYNSQTQK